MKIFFLNTFLLLYFITNVNAGTPQWLWAKGIGGSGQDDAFAIAVDSSLNVYTTGAFSSTVDFDPGPRILNLTSTGQSDIFVSKSDGSGNLVWVKQFGDISYDSGNSIALDDSGNVYFTGAFTGTVDFDPGPGVFNLTSDSVQFEDIFVCKLSTSGNLVWAKNFGALGGDAGNSIVLDKSGSGNIYVTGTFGGTADFDPSSGVYNLTAYGDVDIFILKLNNQGNLIWAKAMGGSGTDVGNCIVINNTTNNEVYVTGFFTATADFDPGANVYYMTATGVWNSFVAKLDTAGHFQWAKGFIGGMMSSGNSLTLDQAGGSDIYCAGEFTDSVDFDPGSGTRNLTTAGFNDIYIVKLNAAGSIIWARQFGGIGSDAANAIKCSPGTNGDIYFTGYLRDSVDFDPGVSSFYLNSNGDYDVYVCGLDSSGNFKFAVSAGGQYGDLCEALAIDQFSNLYLSGYFFSPNIPFGPTTLVNAVNDGSRYDLFIAKLDPSDAKTEINTVNDSEKHLSIFPNPASEFFNIHLKDQATAFTVNIFDICGKIAYSESQVNTNNIQLNTANLVNGIYTVVLEGNNFIEKSKLAILH